MHCGAVRCCVTQKYQKSMYVSEHAWRCRTADVTGTITLPEGVGMCMPGDNISADFQLITPIPLQQGLKFAIREGGRTVGAGVVSEPLP